MTQAECTEYLIEEILAADGDTTWVESLRTAAMAKINSGAGEISPVTTASIGGKSFGREIRMDPLTLARCCRAALDFVAGNAVSSTRMDFSQLGN